MRWRSAAGMPGPLSATCSAMPSGSVATLTSMRPPGDTYLMAFSMQVHEHLREQLAVAARARGLGATVFERDFARRRLRAVEIHELARERCQVHGFLRDVAAAALGLRDLQQCAQRPLHALQLRQRRLHRAARVLAQTLVLQRLFDAHARSIERTAQIVRSAVERGAQHVGLQLDGLEHAIDGGAELVELVVSLLDRQAPRQVARHDRLAGICECFDAATDAPAVGQTEDGREQYARPGPPEHCGAQSRGQSVTFEDVRADEQPAPAGKQEHLRAHGVRDDAARLARVDLEFDPAAVSVEVVGPVREVARDRIAVRLDQQVHRAGAVPAVGTPAQGLHQLQQAAARIVVDEMRDFAADDGIDFAVEHARGEDVDRRQHQRDGRGKDHDEQRGEARRR